MGWQDRDYGKRAPKEDDDLVDRDFRDDSSDEEYEAEEDDDRAHDDPEAPDASDRDDSDDPAEIPCPNCRKPIVEDAEQCHHCGEFIEDDATKESKAWWVWAGLVLAIVVAVMWAISP